MSNNQNTAMPNGGVNEIRSEDKVLTTYHEKQMGELYFVLQVFIWVN